MTDIPDPLFESVNEDQLTLLATIYEPFARLGTWPIWQYVDWTLERTGHDAATVLASLPIIRHPAPAQANMSYGLVWRENSMNPASEDKQICLTVAGLHQLSQDGTIPECGEYLRMIRQLVTARERQVVQPSPTEVVNAVIGQEELAGLLFASGRADTALRMAKLRSLFEHETLLCGTVGNWQGGGDAWSVRLTSLYRDLREVYTIEDYIRWMVANVSPPFEEPIPATHRLDDLPDAIGYLDAVWHVKTGRRLFVNLNAQSVAGVTKPCLGEQEFNSRMSSLADVLGCVLSPGKTEPSKFEALKTLKKNLPIGFEAGVAARIGEAIDVLRKVCIIRSGQQHGRARSEVVAKFRDLGLAYPPADWGTAWGQIVTVSVTALIGIREEVNAGLPDHH